ncbi:MAG: hypothetical protein N2053_11305 [Chitinispirillaceae bacterium]|nr:hypothetical protein [Chitinispirillaceae bacterium]
MKEIRLKKIIFSTLIILLTSHFTYSQIELDGVTSASTRLKINKIYVYPTKAIIKWWDYYNNGDKHMLYWGKTENKYTDSMDLKPFNRQTDVYDTIKNLSPGTKYYCEIYRTYTRKNSVVHTKFTFTTPNETAVLYNGIKNRDFLMKEKITIFSVNGKKVVEIDASFLTLSQIKNYIATIVPKGVYIIVAKNLTEIKRFSMVVQ